MCVCQVECFVDFLCEYLVEQIYLIGDIIDFWVMSCSIYWLLVQNIVVQKLLCWVCYGDRVVFIFGNYDEVLCDYCGVVFGDIEVVDELVYEMVDGWCFLFIYGDVFDQVMCYYCWVVVFGDKVYDLLVWFNLLFFWGWCKFGIVGYWLLVGYVKCKVKMVFNFMFDFEDLVIYYVCECGLDGVICGYIYWVMICEIDGFSYVNCGDWVDFCMVIVEYFDGCFELVVWGMCCIVLVLIVLVV